MVLIEKKTDGSKIIKKFSSPQSLYQRLLASDRISPTKKKELTKIFNPFDTFVFEKKMKNKIINILKLYS